MSSSREWKAVVGQQSGFNVTPFLRVTRASNASTGSTGSHDSGYGSSGSFRKSPTANTNASSYCKRHTDQYSFGGHSIGQLWHNITQSPDRPKSNTRTLSARESQLNKTGTDGGPVKPSLGSGIVQKCQKVLRHTKFGERGSKNTGKGKDDPRVEGGEEVKNEANAEAKADHNPAAARSATVCSTSSAPTTALSYNQQTKATETTPISSHPTSSDDDVTGDESEITDSNYASSSDRTWSLTSMSRALESPGVASYTILTQYQSRLVDNLMSEFHSLINSEGFVARSRAGSEGSSTNCDGSSGGNTHQTNTVSSGSGTRKRPRDQDGRNGTSKDQDQDGELPKMQRIHSPSPSTTSRKLACPYFRQNPANHLKYRSCAGPGWPTVHRVKEHVYRRHSASVRCARCGETFEAESSLEDHYRLPQTCELRSEPLQTNGLTKEQEKALRKRKKLVSEEEKWRDMYRILFPGVGGEDGDDDDIPSPYYDDAPAQIADEFQRYEQYLHRELPQLVRRRLEEAVSGFTTPLENQLRGQLVDIVRNSQSELFRSYRSAAGASSSMPGGEASDSLLPPLNFMLQQPLTSGGGGAHSIGPLGGNGANETALRELDLDANFVDPGQSSLMDFSAYGEPPAMDDELAGFSSAEVSSWAAQATVANLNPGYSIFSDSGYVSNMNEEFGQFSGEYSDCGIRDT